MTTRAEGPRSTVLRAAAAGCAVALLLAAAPGFAAKGGAKGKPEGAGKPAKTGKPAKSKADAHEASPRGSSASRDVFTRTEARTVRRWFADGDNLRGLPPGLAKRESLPPGLQKQLERNGTLPPGLQSRLEPLPRDLEARLPALPTGVRRAVLGRDVLLVEDGSNRIRDILRDVLPALVDRR